MNALRSDGQVVPSSAAAALTLKGTAKSLTGYAGLRDGYVVFQDLAAPRSEDVEHLVIGLTGVFVVDSTRWTGQILRGVDVLVGHNHYSLDRAVETVRREADTLGRLLGIRPGRRPKVRRDTGRGGRYSPPEGAKARGTAMVDRPPQPASDNGIKAQPRRGLSRSQVVAALALVLLLLICVFWLPERLYPRLTDTDLKDVKNEQGVLDAAKVQELKDARLKLQNDARTTLLQGLGALLVLTGAAIGASVTLAQVQATRDQIAETAKASQDQLRLSNRQLRTTWEGQITERYTRAIDQLGNDQLDVRLGGIYALERIAHDSSDDRTTIGEVLTAFVRSRAPWSPRLPGQYVATAPIDKVPELQVRAGDVQASLTVLGRGGFAPAAQAHGDRLDLHAVDLRQANLRGAHLEAMNLADAHLEGADLRGAYLQGATLADAHLEKANLVGTHLETADLGGAQLNEAYANEHTVWPNKQFDWRGAGVIVAWWDTAAYGP